MFVVALKIFKRQLVALKTTRGVRVCSCLMLMGLGARWRHFLSSLLG